MGETILIHKHLIVGRTNNARFLQRNFQGNRNKLHDSEGDITAFELMVSRLGPYNVLIMS